MILRRPYALLIKYFRIIHILMFIFFTYLVFAIRPIYLFFADYISNNSNMYFENIALKYVPVILFIVVILNMALAIAIYFLMRKKDKPVLFYKLVVIYSSVLFIALIYFYFFFKSLSTTNYDNLRIVVNRDIIMILYYVNFLFVGFSFIRAFGFDIKKFSFEKDRKELKLEESDKEEYEVNIKVEKEDFIDYFNRQRRELKYYFEENSTFFIIISVIIVVSLSLYIGYNYFVVNKVYHQDQDVNIGNITYNVSKSTITTVDKYGKIISDDSDFLVVYLSINNQGMKTTLDDQQFRVNVSGNYFYPVINYCNLFNDLGTCYTDSNLTANMKFDYILVYKIEKKHSSIIFEILKNKDGYQYSKVKLSFKNDNKEVLNYNKGDTFSIDNNDYQVLNYAFYNKTTYTYESCPNNKCSNYIKIITPKLGNRVLKVEIANLEKLTDNFLDNYIGIKYRNKVLYGSDIEVLGRYQNNVYLSIPGVVHDEDKIELMINTRIKEYNILLKEGVNE